VIDLRVLGHPAPQGSKRHVGRGIMVEASKAVTPWREAVVAECQRTGVAGRLLDGGLDAFLTFYFPRPQSHYKGDGNVKPTAPLFPIRRSVGDIDKLVRSTLDALVQASVIADDSLVVNLGARKRYATIANPRGAVIRVIPIGESIYEPSA
jgi:crossover junction endodeoxyribonuclease RusA